MAPVIYSAKKKTVDLYVSRMERRTPFFLMAITSYACAATIFFITDSRIMFLVAVSYICVTLSVMLVNLFWKISVHSAAVAGPVAGLVYVFGIKAMPLYVLLVPIVWARMKLGAHTLAQLIAGIVLSTLVTLGVCAFLYP